MVEGTSTPALTTLGPSVPSTPWIRRVRTTLDMRLRIPIFDHGVGFIDIDRSDRVRQQSFYSLHEVAKL